MFAEVGKFWTLTILDQRQLNVFQVCEPELGRWPNTQNCSNFHQLLLECIQQAVKFRFWREVSQDSLYMWGSHIYSLPEATDVCVTRVLVMWSIVPPNGIFSFCQCALKLRSFLVAANQNANKYQRSYESTHNIPTARRTQPSLISRGSVKIDLSESTCVYSLWSNFSTVPSEKASILCSHIADNVEWQGNVGELPFYSTTTYLVALCLTYCR